jgi:hypothetical protein
MALNRGPCSDTTGTIKRISVELLCQWNKNMATDLSQSDSQKILKWCTADEMDRMEDEDKVGYVGSKDKSVSSECETRWKL